MPENFTVQDILGILVALCLYPFVFIFPGYLTGWAINLFHFRNRRSITQMVMAMSISASVVPAGLFLVYRFGSARVAIPILLLTAVGAIYLFTGFYKRSSIGIEYVRLSALFAGLWILLSTITLVDLQIGDRLYYGTNSYDFATRVSVVEAITRTGVPPVNPSYYPGHPVLLNSLYYYWYILVSVVDQMGGSLVSPYQAMLASVTWAGLLLFATLATYLRVRDKWTGENAWKKSFIGLQLTAVGGLDFIVILMIAAILGFHLEKLPFQGHLEGWNMPIMSWMNALAWVPHHLTAALACMPAILLVAQGTQRKFYDRIPHAVFIGLAFASAFGLSVWVMFVFAVFWALWAMVLVFREKKYQDAGFMVLSAGFGVIFVFPFLLGIMQEGAASPAGGLPVAFHIRPFMVVDLLSGFPAYVYPILNLLFLPLNYLLELGFFLLMAAIWFRDIYKKNGASNPIFTAEVILVLISVVILSFLRSTIIVINDLGIRGWLPMQFILVIWSSDVLFNLASQKRWISPTMFGSLKGTDTLRLVLGSAMIIGYLTMGLEFISLRGWPIFIDRNKAVAVNESIVPPRLGEHTYSARLTYEYLRDHVDGNAIVQNNPLISIDRPSGLYGNHQMVISDHTIYGVSIDVYYSLANDVGEIFIRPDLEWDFIDEKCNQYLIDYLIVSDNDPLWGGLQASQRERSPLYKNNHYMIYTCGN